MQSEVVNLHYQKYDVYIGRPSKWGNPFKVGIDGNRKQVIEKYRQWLLTQKHLLDNLHELEGKRLGCYCYPHPCHGDILVELIGNIGDRKTEVLSLKED